MAKLHLIATAPTDGTEIILARVGKEREFIEIDIGYWEIYGGRDDPEGYDPPYQGWVSYRGIEEPTHWMPKPEIESEP